MVLYSKSLSLDTGFKNIEFYWIFALFNIPGRVCDKFNNVIRVNPSTTTSGVSLVRVPHTAGKELTLSLSVEIILLDYYFG